jgi:hypothetical protein
MTGESISGEERALDLTCDFSSVQANAGFHPKSQLKSIDEEVRRDG